MCGIVGIVGGDPVAIDIYTALSILQHRGQDAAGIATGNGRKFNLRKKDGLVREVFKQRHMDKLDGNIGIGHVRYPTAGTAASTEAQPFYVNSPYGISLVHNGTITNAERLAESLFNIDLRHVNSQSDSEVLLNVLAHMLVQTNGDVFAAVHELHQVIHGAYACVAMILGKGLLAFRDRFGIRPLIIGKKGNQYMVASESVALTALGFEVIRNVQPGEAIFVDLKGNLRVSPSTLETRSRPCIFEYVYLARPDSVIDRISVYKSRLRMGEKLGQRINKIAPNFSSDIDVVIPIPETSRTTAITVASKIKRPLREGFVKNRYIGRTFIMPEQRQRENGVRQKFSPIDLEFCDKRVCLVDDSIVRGTTSRAIIKMVRECGAKSVTMLSASPPIRYPNVYGIDMPASTDFVAHNRDEEQIRDYLGVDELIYQSLDDLIEACTAPDLPGQEFETSIFDGNYITQGIDVDYLSKLEQLRGGC